MSTIPGGRSATVTRTLLALSACACTLLLAGCPDTGTSTVATKTPPNATAPALPKTIGGNNAQTAAQNAVQTAALTPAQAEQARKVAALIQNVDSHYQSGVQNYQNNRLDAARLDFDFAVDLMLTSGIDIAADPTLNDEFERTVNAVNSLEMDALKQGNGFSPKAEQAPVDAVGDLTFPSDPALTASLKSTLNVASDLPLVINDEVAGYINAFANSSAFHAHMVASLQRAGKYRAMIQDVLRQEGVPQDLIYLAVAESGFQPQAMNAGSGAGGMWQFMPTSAYGLTRNGYFDERFDPEKSSRAYARYIKGLYNQFGDWYLAMAGYNWGPGNVQRAVQRTGYADFWQLYRRNAMPRETKNYVPQILAAVIMAKNPEKYGLDKVTLDAPVLWDTVHVDYAMDLRLVADVTGVSLANVVSLNPALLRLGTPADIPFDLHIPQGTKSKFDERIAAIPETRRSTWRFHEAAPGETVDQVAQLFHVSAADLLAANSLPANSPIEEGDELVIPVAGSGGGSNAVQYTTRRGDTLVTVADRFNVTAEQLRTWNHLRSATLTAGRRIYVAEPVRLAPASRGRRRAASTKAAKGRAVAAPRSRVGNTSSTRSRGTSAARTSSPAKSSGSKKRRR